MARSKHIPDDITTLPRSAAEARAVGARYYYTGQPCLRGHLAARQTGNQTCQQCANEKSLEKWHEGAEERARKKVFTFPKDGHAIAERLQRIEDLGLEVVLAEEAEERARQSAAAVAKARARRLQKMEEEGTEEVREQEREQGRQSYWRNVDSQRERARDRHRSGRSGGYRGLRIRTPPWLTTEELTEIDAIYASRDRSGTNPDEVDHFFPIDDHPTLTGTHVPWNLQVLTRTANSQRQRTRRDGFTCTDEEAELYIACGMAVRKDDQAPDGTIDWSRYPRPGDEMIARARQLIARDGG